MINYDEIISKFESAYKHLGSNAEDYLLDDINFWERAGMVDFVTANVLRSINTTIAENHGKLK